MASYRPFPTQPPPQQPAFAPPPQSNPNQGLPPPPGPPPSNANPYQQHHQHTNYGLMRPNSNAQQPYGAHPPYNPSMPRQQQPPQYQYQMHPPQQTQQPPASSYNMPIPPPPALLPHQQPQQIAAPNQQAPMPPVYYQSSSASQYQSQQFNQQHSMQSLPPPPMNKPASPPPMPPSSLPPPPPPPPTSSSRPPHQMPNDKDRPSGSNHHPSHSKQSFQSRSQKPPPAAPSGRAAPLAHHSNGPSGRVETEEERRIRKRKEYEKQKQEEKRRQMYKEAQATMLQKTQMMSSGMKPHGSLAGSRLMDRKSTAFLAAERTENRLKKPTTFLCRLKFRNDLPDPSAQPKLLAMNTNKDRFTKYTITSLEKMHKPKLYLEPDLGIPLDLLDISVYNPPAKCPRLAPEDEELLRDSEVATPVKQEGGIRIKERPTDKGMAWLVKTQYISPLSMESAKQSITEKQAKERREEREGRNIFLENLNSREKQIQAIEESFKAAEMHPVHQSNPKLEPVEIWPLLPDFERYEDRFLMVAFDGDPTAESEMYNKLDRSIRDDIESQAIMKSLVVRTNPEKSEKFLAYMVPKPDEVLKDIYDEDEEVDYAWIKEYHWDVREGDAHDPTTYLVNFDDNVARYLPLPTKLVLQKRRSKEGKSGEEIEHFPPPSKVTVRKRSILSAGEAGPSQGLHSAYDNESSLKRARMSVEDGQEDDHEEEETRHMEDVDQYSGEEELSE